MLRTEPGTLEMFVPLELLNSGEWADVADVVGEPLWVSRLAELGLRVGSRLQMLQPGRPCLLQIDGCRLSLRGELSSQVLVRLVTVQDRP